MIRILSDHTCVNQKIFVNLHTLMCVGNGTNRSLLFKQV